MELAVALPLLPDREEPFRRFWQALEGDRRAEFVAATASRGLTVLRVSVLSTTRLSFAVITLRGETPHAAIRRLVQSVDPYDGRIRDSLAQLLGVNVTARYVSDELYSEAEEVSLAD